ncbi:MAG TPA: NUDIX domain-containing protein [Candidatus Mediterraneibacter gallistercoris]|uniref:NUDIX domain-containing protein n=1 Tax=Candidatus Mediterraneibacter gallistercoris TaxID=2838671 RepID=A0A9D2P6D9_9FIRM|nr:NUDIX domain-containing protein [Candidatus Mediterraneibacter gallistercoris]
MERLSTLCYIEQDGKYLMLHRTVKKNDVNKDKWIGVGGHFEHGESPEECLLREVKEETGYTLTSWKYRGIVTFVYGEDTLEYMSLYTADGFTGNPIECDEGELEWVDKKDIPALELWEGDKIFFRLLDMEREFFSLKLVYNRSDVLQYAALDGEPLELFDEIREDGSRTGVVKERGVVHEDGSLHPTVHTWIVRPNDKSGYDLLLQKRSECKDSNPGCWDISSAGHVEAGHGYLESAIRELKEELGIDALPEQLREVGTRRCGFESEFYGRPFRDNELSMIYIYEEPVNTAELTLQESEVSETAWMDYKECRRKVAGHLFQNCIYEDELDMVGRALKISI